MTVETDEVEQTNEQAAQSFAAGFDSDEQTTTPATPEVKTEPAEPVATEEKTEAEPPKYAQITEAQLNDLMAKANQFDDSKRKIDTLSGHIGGLKQTLEGLKAQQVKIGPGQLKRLSAEFPELAEMLAEDLGALSGSPVDPQDIDKRVQEKVEAALQKDVAAEIEILSEYHSDWKEINGSAEFAEWKNTLSPARKAKLEASVDGEYIASRMTEFKAAKEAKDKAAADAAKAAEAAKTSNNRQKRLEAAVTPRGTGGQTSSRNEQSDFMAGWNSG